MSSLDNGAQVSSGQQSPQSEKPQRSITGLRWALVCLALYSCNFLYGLDNTIVADIQAPIISSLDHVNKLGWLGIGFPLGSFAAILPIGKAYSIFDTKWLYIGSLTMFAAGSALCGAAPTMDALIVGRVWAGAGGAGMYLGNLNMYQRLTNVNERGVYMASVILVYGSGVILGPVIGGALADSSSSGWRWAFYLNLFIFAVMTPIYIVLLPSIQPRPDLNTSTKLRSMDWLGIFLSCAIYTSFAMVFTFGGSIWNWGEGSMIALYVVLVAVVVIFAVTQRFAVLVTNESRLFPWRFLSDRTLTLLLVSCTALTSALYVLVYYLPLFYSLVRGESGIQTAVRLLPFVILFVAGVMFNGIFMVRWGYYMPWYLVSGILTTMGGALLYATDVNTSNAHFYGYSALVGIGQISFQAAYSIAPGKVSPDQTAEVIQFLNVGQQGSILIALAISNTIFQNVSFQRLLPLLIPAGYTREDVTAAIAGARSIVLQTAPPGVKQAAFEVLTTPTY